MKRSVDASLERRATFDHMESTSLDTEAGEAAKTFFVRHLLRLARDYREAFPRPGFDGLEPAEMQVLLVLRDQPGLGVRKIANALDLARPSVSNAVRTLHERGYVREGGQDADGRCHPQHLTVAGSIVIDQFVAASRVVPAD